MKSIYNLLARLLPTKSVDQLVGIITGFAKQLAAAEAAETLKAEGIAADISDLTTKREEALASAARASRVARKLDALTA